MTGPPDPPHSGNDGKLASENLMHDQLIGYLLEALDVEETTSVQRILERDIEARQKLGSLQTALQPLQGDRKHVEAPPTLAIRTCQRIREVRRLDQLRET